MGGVWGMLVSGSPGGGCEVQCACCASNSIRQARHITGRRERFLSHVILHVYTHIIVHGLSAL